MGGSSCTRLKAWVSNYAGEIRGVERFSANLRRPDSAFCGRRGPTHEITHEQKQTVPNERGDCVRDGRSGRRGSKSGLRKLSPNSKLAEGASAYGALYAIYFNHLFLAFRPTHQSPHKNFPVRRASQRYAIGRVGWSSCRSATSVAAFGGKADIVLRSGPVR